MGTLSCRGYPKRLTSKIVRTSPWVLYKCWMKLSTGRVSILKCTYDWHNCHHFLAEENKWHHLESRPCVCVFVCLCLCFWLIWLAPFLCWRKQMASFGVVACLCFINRRSAQVRQTHFLPAATQFSYKIATYQHFQFQNCNISKFSIPKWQYINIFNSKNATYQLSQFQNINI